VAVAACLGVLALSSVPAAARPLYKLYGHVLSAQPPTTADCEAAFKIACYDAHQFQTAYDMGPLFAAGDTGAGKTIVIVDSFGSPTIRHDLKEFDTQNGLPAPPSFNIIAPVGAIPPFDPGKNNMGGWAVETSLDVEMAHTMAPGANILLVETPVAETEGVTGFPQIIAAENYVLAHHLGDVISQSFGATEQTFPSPASIFALRSAYERAFRDHVTVLAATGDAGSTDYELNLMNFYRHRVVDWPSTDPLVTAVGGTQLHLNQDGVRTAPDNVWNDPVTVCAQPCAGSGGLSVVFSRPAYQDSVQNVVGDARGVPDIAMSAAVNGSALVYMSFRGLPGPGWYLIGGTSEASPLTSGFVAVADQTLGSDLGLLNPDLYTIGDAAGSGIVDITRGNNTVTFAEPNGDVVTVPGFDAVPGYDLASGLGTIDGAKLVSQLQALPH
jgi:subtilase family serine protease